MRLRSFTLGSSPQIEVAARRMRCSATEAPGLEARLRSATDTRTVMRSGSRGEACAPLVMTDAATVASAIDVVLVNMSLVLLRSGAIDASDGRARRPRLGPGRQDVRLMFC